MEMTLLGFCGRFLHAQIAPKECAGFPQPVQNRKTRLRPDLGPKRTQGRIEAKFGVRSARPRGPSRMETRRGGTQRSTRTDQSASTRCSSSIFIADTLR